MKRGNKIAPKVYKVWQNDFLIVKYCRTASRSGERV